MPEQETVKLEIEIPKDQIHLLTDSDKTEPAPKIADSEDMNKELRIAKFKKQLAEARASKSLPAPESKVKESIEHKSPLDKLPSTSDKSPPNSNQRKLIILGLITALGGLILWPLANFVVAIAIATVGAAAIAAGTFVKV